MSVLIGLRNAWGIALAADSLTSAVIAGSSTTVIKVDDVTGWTANDVAHFTGAAVGEVRRVSVVDSVADTLTVSPALAATPDATDVVRGGVAEWLAAAAGSLQSRRPQYQTPIAGILNNTDERGCVILFGSLPGVGLPFKAIRAPWEIRCISRKFEYAEGAATRIFRRFSQRPDLIVVGTGLVLSLCIATDEPIEAGRTDKFFEYLVPFDTRCAEVAA